jgi:hypothetical protein
MVRPEEQAENDALLAWLRSGSASRPDPGEQKVKDYLLQGRREKRPLDELTRALLPPTRKATGHEIEQARRASVGWTSLGYGVEEVRPWLRAGVDPRDHELVAELVSEGITPDRAGKQFQHPRTGELLTILDVARSFYIRYRTGDFSSLSAALDDAGIERVKRPRPSLLPRRHGSAPS